MIQYDHAVHVERDAWLKVRGKHLGTDSHDAVLWREWVRAVEQMQQLSLQLKNWQSAQHPEPPAGGG